MSGRAGIGKKLSGVIPNCFLLTKDDKLEPAKNPLNVHSTIGKHPKQQKLSPAYSFAVEMAKSSQGKSIALVVNARGGSSIQRWAKGTEYYTEAIRRTKEAMKTGTLKGIIWHQGESDNQKSKKSSGPEGYLDKLEVLIGNLRKDLNAPNLPFVAGQINTAPPPKGMPGAKLINDQIAKLPETVKGTAFASAEGLKTTDAAHFDSNSIILLGERYAEKMLALQGVKK